MAPIGAVCSGYMLFVSILNSSVMEGNYLQQMTSADDIFRCNFFLALKGLNQVMMNFETQGRLDLAVLFTPFTPNRQNRNQVCWNICAGVCRSTPYSEVV